MVENKLRFGTMSVKMGLITKKQLVEALSIQVDDEIEERGHRLIGTILFDLGYIGHREIDKVLDALEKR